MVKIMYMYIHGCTACSRMVRTRQGGRMEGRTGEGEDGGGRG